MRIEVSIIMIRISNKELNLIIKKGKHIMEEAEQKFWEEFGKKLGKNFKEIQKRFYKFNGPITPNVRNGQLLTNRKDIMFM